MELDSENGVGAAIETVVCSDPDIQFAVAFGSRISGTPRPSSDIDIALKFADHLSRGERFRKRCALAGQLQQDDGPFVDVSDIEALSLEAAHDALDGVVLCGDEATVQAFADAIEAELNRRQPDLEQHRRETIQRIATDGLHG